MGKIMRIQRRAPGRLKFIEMAWPICASLLLHVLLVLILCSSSAYYPAAGAETRFDVIWATPASPGNNFPLQGKWIESLLALGDSGGVAAGCSAEIPPCPALPGGEAEGLAQLFEDKSAPAAKERLQELEVFLVSAELPASAEVALAEAMPAQIISQGGKPKARQQVFRQTGGKAPPPAGIPRKLAGHDARKWNPAVAAQIETPLMPELQDDPEDAPEPVAEAAPEPISVPALKNEEERRPSSEHDLEISQVRLAAGKAGAEPRTGRDSRERAHAEEELSLEQARLSSALEEANRLAAQKAAEQAERGKAEAERLSRQARLSQEQEEHKRLRAERERTDGAKREKAEREGISQQSRLSQERQELKRQAVQRSRTETLASDKAQRDKISEPVPPLRAKEEAPTRVPRSRGKIAVQKMTGRAAVPVPGLAAEGKVAALKEKTIAQVRQAPLANPLTPQQAAAVSPAPLTRLQEVRPARNSAGTEPAGRAAAGADQAVTVQREPAQTPEKGKGTKPSEQPRQARGLVIAALRGDLKLVLTGNTGIKISVKFRDYPKSRRSKALPRSEGRREQSVLPVLAATREDTREAVIETAREGVYTFSAEPEGAKGVRASFTLKAFESGPRERIAVLGTRTISGTTVLVKILMPEAILWSDESAFTGSMEDSESETRFNAATGLFWKEFHD